MRVRIQHLGGATPGLSSWAKVMPGLLPEHVWLPGDDSTADVDLDVLILGSGPLGPIPQTPALVVPSGLDAYREWTRGRREALAFLCLSSSTAQAIRAEQAAPCTFLPWDVSLPDDTGKASPDTGALITGANVPPSAVWFFLPSGDAPSARHVAQWLAGPGSGGDVPVVVVGPMSADAEQLLRRAGARDRLTVMDRPADALVLGGVGSARSAVVIDLTPSAEITGYLGPIVRRGCPALVIAGGAYADLGPDGPVTLLPASTGLQAAALAITSFIEEESGPSATWSDPGTTGRHVDEVLAAGVARAIDLAASYRPAQEAIQSLRSSLLNRGLLDAETAAAAADSFAWMLHEQPWADYDP